MSYRSVLALLSVFASTVAFGQQFNNVASTLGVSHYYTGEEYGGGVSFYDVNNDGWDDLTFATCGYGVQLFLNNEGTFLPPQYITPNVGEIKQVLWCDYDNDNDPDLFVTCFNSPNKLFRNNGNIFDLEDFTVQAGLPSYSAMTYGCSLADYDLDGDLDLYVCNYNSAVYSNYFYKNNGDGTFSDITIAMGLSDGYCYSFQPLFLDLDGDLYPELFVINDRLECSNTFWKNDNGNFINQTASRGLEDYYFSMNNSAADYDLDGDYDYYVSNNPFGNRLYNNSNGYFTNVAGTAGAAVMDHSWAALWFDFDNDMDEDLYVSTTEFWSQPGLNRLLVNQGNGTFLQGNLLHGLGTDTGNSPSSALGDINNDGQPDMVSVHDYPGYTRLYRNTGTTNNWTKIKLTGTASNKEAIGVNIEIYAGGLKQMRYTHTSEGYLGQHSNWEFVGLGQNTNIDSLVIHWPSGLIDRLYNQQVNQPISIIEGSSFASGITVSDYEICENEIITLVAFGGASYTWNTGIENDTLLVTEPGVYWFSGLTNWGVPFTSDQVVITAAPDFDVNVNIINESCPGMSDGALTVEMVDGSNIDLLLVNGLPADLTTPQLPPGNYSIIAYNDVGCFDQHFVQVLAAAPIGIDIDHAPILCSEGTTSIEVGLFGGAGGYELDWQGIDPSEVPAGFYNLTVTDQNDCVAQFTVDILEPQPVVVENNLVHATETTNGAIEYEISGGIPPYILQTFGPGGFWSNQTTLSELAPGLYNWVCVDANGCSISGQTEVLFITHVNELSTTYPIRVFPNPASAYFNIQSDCPIEHIDLFSSSGKLILSSDVNSELLGTVRIDDLSSGFYLIETSTSCGKSRNYIVVE